MPLSHGWTAGRGKSLRYSELDHPPERNCTMSESAPNTPPRFGDTLHADPRQNEIAALLARLDALERSRGAEPTTDHRNTKGLWIVIAILGLVIVGLGAWEGWVASRYSKMSKELAATRFTLAHLAEGNFKALRAQQIQVVDGVLGQPLVTLTQTESGEGLVVTKNGKGQDLVTLGTTTNGEGAVVTTNGRGQELVTLVATTDGGGTVITKNGMGLDLVRLGVTEGGGGTVATTDGKGQDLVVLGSTTGDDGTVTTTNSLGKDLVMLGASEGGAGMIRTTNGKGQDLVTLGIAGGGGTITTTNGKGQELVKLGVDKEGRGLIGAFDPTGTFGRALLAPGP
jgi:hypothetical protein